MSDDAQLLQRYVAERSQEAFAELVHRHVNLVYFAALRRLGGDRSLADDVTQTVFADLARKAASLQRHAILTGWLYTSTRFAASRALRGERRRRVHETEAHAMHELHSSPEADWEQLRPVIDDVLDELNDRDREALLLRFFENQPLAEIGARFGLSPDGARMRIDRALDRLRASLVRRGIVSTAAALAGIFASQTANAAPAELVAKIVAGAAVPAGAGAVTAAGLWKMLAVGAGVLAIGAVVVLSRSSVEGEVQVVPPQTPQIAAETIKPASPPELITAPAAETARATPVRVEANDFAELGLGEKEILKNFRTHQLQAIDPTRPGWAFRISPEAPTYLAFQAAAAQLKQRGLVHVVPDTGMVLLTEQGRSFCTDHAADLDAMPEQNTLFRGLSGRGAADVPEAVRATPARVEAIDFAALGSREKNILKTFRTHQLQAADSSGWAFRAAPETPDYVDFQAAATRLEQRGLVRVKPQTGFVLLTEQGRSFCADHAADLDAMPEQNTQFRRLNPNTAP